MRVRAIAVVIGMLGTALLSGTVSAAEESPRIRADLEGRPIKASEIGSYWNGTGNRTDFCCNQTVPGLSSAVDDTLTSVYRG